MATDFTGTNTEKIDKLIAAIIELPTTLRLCFGIIGVGFPLGIGLLTFLVVQSFSTASRVERLTDQIVTMKGDLERMNDRLNKLEHRGRP